MLFRSIGHVGNARNQREAAQIQTAGNLDASHADPLVRLQSYGGVARFRPHYVANPCNFEGYRYVLESDGKVQICFAYIDAKQRRAKTPVYV